MRMTIGLPSVPPCSVTAMGFPQPRSSKRVGGHNLSLFGCAFLHDREQLIDGRFRVLTCQIPRFERAFRSASGVAGLSLCKGRSGFCHSA